MRSDGFVTFNLFEIIYAALKQLLILFAGNIAEQTGSEALAVPHLAEYTSVGAGNALDSVQAAVRIIRRVHRRHALHIYILRSDLSVGEQLLNHAFRRIEAAFAVGYGDSMLLARLAAAQPGGFIRNYPGRHNLRNVAADIIKC